MEANLPQTKKQKELPIFSDREKDLIKEIEDYLNCRSSPFYTLMLQRKEDLELLASIVHRSPALTKDMNLFGEHRSKKTLLEKIKNKGLNQVINMPTKVVLGFGFSVSDLHFWGFLVKLTFKFPDLEHLKEPVEEAYSDVLFTLMAEELYRSLLSRREKKKHITHFVASELIQLWENRFKYKTEFFAPYIRELWTARQQIVPVLGTLVGVMELMRLNFLLTPIWNDFLEWYYSQSYILGESLEEFLFDLKYEEICLLRNYMRENQIAAVDRLNGTEIIVKLLEESPEKLKERQKRYNQPLSLQLYQSFLRRREDGVYRQKNNLKGPYLTLEEHFLRFLILEKPT